MKTFSLVAASMALLSGLAAADDQTTSVSTLTSTRTVLHVVTETHYSSTELETSTELIATPVVATSSATPVSATPVSATNTPVTTPVVYSAGNSTTPLGTGGFVSSAKATGSGSVAGATGAASASPTPPTGAASSLKIDAALAAIVAGAGYLLL
ncbi:mucin-5ac-like [Diplodia corticola]|uniref:Mucin-5ac-like n=1 Tax=Diplodia corticola TaxID=236234 RepID=A0A1J9QPE8_9PEZI|nr:mucin-5ac-like [Diplodia corticola]OJD30328.1 mucin-5ac-like [Diplodia corticola]